MNTIKIQDDGKIIIGGAFTSYNGTLANRIIRLNTDGTPDPFFNVGSGMNDEVKAVYLQPDGKVLIGGWFSNFNSLNVPKMIRLNGDGTLDNTFTSSIIGDAIVINMQADGKILVGGYFSGKITRLNIDGSPDNSFNIGSGFNGSTIYAIYISYFL